jgi:hypothetical protein
VPAHSVEYLGMPPDQGCYEERYRLTGQAILGLGVGLVAVGLGVWWSPGVSPAAVILAIPVVSSVAGVILALPGVVAVACRMIAFRADCMGITLGAAPDNLTFFGRGAVFVPWAEIEQIVLYFASPQGPGACAPAQRISLRRREAAVALVPATASCTARRITGWRLDAERLAAVAAVVAPGVSVIDARTGSGLDAESRSRSDAR